MSILSCLRTIVTSRLQLTFPSLDLIDNLIDMRILIFCFILLSSFSAASEELVDTTSPYDQVRPEITEYMAQPAILVFSKTRAWRHNEGIAGADRFFADLAQERGYGLFTTVNGAVFNAEDLSRFQVIVFNNMTGNTLSPEQRSAFETWLRNGGAWLGLHAAGDNSHTAWEWYDRRMIGPEFTSHPMAPQFQEADLVLIGGEHPILEGLPERFSLTDEWYSFDSLPARFGLTPLVGLDESTYSPRNTVYGISDLRMGPEPEDHPIIWSGEIDEGRLVYSAVGHNQTPYDDPVYAQLLTQAFEWVTKAR